VKATYVIINDGEIRYPVAIDALRPQDSERTLQKMSRRQYDKWATTVPGALGNEAFVNHLLGSAVLASKLNAMHKAGCPEWYVPYAYKRP
jgi:hypothetical protein